MPIHPLEVVVRLHAILDKSERAAKRAYVLFLVSKPELVLADVKQNFAHEGVSQGLSAMPQRKAPGVTLGSATWSTFATSLQRELARSRDGEAKELLQVLIGEFVAGLRLRRLVVPAWQQELLDLPGDDQDRDQQYPDDSSQAPSPEVQ